MWLALLDCLHRRIREIRLLAARQWWEERRPQRSADWVVLRPPEWFDQIVSPARRAVGQLTDRPALANAVGRWSRGERLEPRQLALAFSFLDSALERTNATPDRQTEAALSYADDDGTRPNNRKGLGDTYRRLVAARAFTGRGRS